MLKPLSLSYVWNATHRSSKSVKQGLLCDHISRHLMLAAEQESCGSRKAVEVFMYIDRYIHIWAHLNTGACNPPLLIMTHSRQNLPCPQWCGWTFMSWSDSPNQGTVSLWAFHCCGLLRVICRYKTIELESRSHANWVSAEERNASKSLTSVK